MGTVTEIYDYLRLLFANAGEAHCAVCVKKISRMTVQEITDKILEFPERTKIKILSPIVRGKKGTHKKLIDNIRKEVFLIIRVDGENYYIKYEIEIEKNKKNDIEVVVDRIIVKPGLESRLGDALASALKLS